MWTKRSEGRKKRKVIIGNLQERLTKESSMLRKQSAPETGKHYFKGFYVGGLAGNIGASGAS